jgi:hypothetical protein
MVSSPNGIWGVAWARSTVDPLGFGKRLIPDRWRMSGFGVNQSAKSCTTNYAGMG